MLQQSRKDGSIISALSNRHFTLHSILWIKYSNSSVPRLTRAFVVTKRVIKIEAQHLSSLTYRLRNESVPFEVIFPLALLSLHRQPLFLEIYTEEPVIGNDLSPY